MSALTLKVLLKTLKEKYLISKQQVGGTAGGFREYVDAEYKRDPDVYEVRLRELLMEAATKQWEQIPRKTGPDLFSINGIIPETLTRRKADFTIGGEEIEDDDEGAFEKVHAQFATVNDLFEDATIKMRKAAQAGTAAEREMRQADEALKRSCGNRATFLRDLADGAAPLAAE